ncbi:serine protease [uncultured Brevundimonas sp.]|uniref:S1 family peptidase n=1 Tax=uncultured Brevundimonas sp. TaxID=213418 RepID=UPI00262AE04A|nr:serine protease [uncultured Brevundimonas sp.]
MRLPLPDWLIYCSVIGVILVASLSRGEKANAPAEPMDDSEALLGPISPFDPTVVVDANDDDARPQMGTAFSIADDGRWITARHVVEGCRQPALIIDRNKALAADVRLAAKTDVALLLTDGGPAPLPLAGDEPLYKGQRAFHPGFPQGKPGEVATRLIGRETLRVRGRNPYDEPVLAWAEAGRTKGLTGTLSGLSGAPVVDRRGRVLGVTIAEAPRRGRIYTTAPQAFVAAVGPERGDNAKALGQVVTTRNYGAVSDQLRRDLRVAQVVCLGV